MHVLRVRSVNVQYFEVKASSKQQSISRIFMCELAFIISRQVSFVAAVPLMCSTDIFYGIPYSSKGKVWARKYVSDQFHVSCDYIWSAECLQQLITNAFIDNAVEGFYGYYS